MKKDFTNWYKNKYEDMAQEPPEELWRNIANKLNQSQVQKRKRNNIIYSSLLVLFLSFTGLFYFFSPNKTTEIVHQATATQPFIIAKNNYASDLKKAEIQAKSTTLSTEHKMIIAENPNAKSEKLRFNNTKNQERNNNIIIDEKVEITAQEEVISNIVENTDQFQNTIEAEGFYFMDVLKYTNYLNDNFNIAEAEMKIAEPPINAIPDKIKQNKFIIGASIFYNNVWIVNSNFYDGIDKNSYSYLKPVYNSGYAVFAGYQFNERKILLTEFSPKNTSSQNYYTYNEGHVSQTNLKLNYVQFNTMMSFNTTTKNRGSVIRSNFNLLTGINFAYLTSAEQTNSKKTTNVYNDYKKNNLGLILGIGHTMNLKEHLSLMLSARGNFGVSNIYSGNDHLPSKLNQTYNQVFSANASLYYKF